MPAPGELLGPYRLVAPLGKGAMGEVWRARDERLDRHVALKVLPSELADDPERRARMLREARAAAAIRHANVVTLFDIVERAEGDILVMELVDGRTVSEVLRKDGAPPLELALRWIEGVADALVAAHGVKILHRDIKAANVMIDSDGRVKVLDFGLAKLGATPEESAAASLQMVAASSGAMASAPDHSPDLALDETRPSRSARPGGSFDPASYATQAGTLLGTPMYMAPEQITGSLPDERSEVFSVGVLAYEILAGKPPYSATTIDELFRQIAVAEPPPLAKVPEPVAAIVMRALAKEPGERWPSMKALRDALAAERARMFAPAARRWPLVAAAVVLALAGGGAAWWWRAHRTAPEQPGDVYVDRALEEYDVFYNDKALSSLRAALRIWPEHPRANAYVILFGGAPEADVAAAVAAGTRARAATAEHSKDRALLDAALAYVERGAAAARSALVAAGAATDRELGFWTAELDYRSGTYAVARDEYRALPAEPAKLFRGRVFDHYSAVLLYLDEPADALAVGTAYRDAYPGEADAVAVYATTLAAAGKLDDALAAAQDAVRLNEGEDTLAGLAKVYALRGDHAKARELYEQAVDRASPARRPLRRAALGFLQWIDGDVAAAKATVAPCLPGGADAAARERGACLFVAGIIDPDHAEVAAAQLDALAAAAIATKPAYGAPTSLAALVRARAHFFGGGCVVDAKRPDLAPPAGTPDEAAYSAPLDFYAAYHVPYFATWAVCEHAALLASRGDRAGAAALLRPVAQRAPNRARLTAALASYQ